VKAKTTCLAVLRTSTAEQAQDEKTGLPAQRREIERWLKSNSFLPAAREIIDVNISAADLMNLKIGNVAKEIANLKRKRAKPGTYALCFANSARMSRAKTLNSLSELLGLIKSGIDIIFCLQNIHVSALDDENTMQMHLMFALSSFQQNRQELLTLSRRTKGVWEENRKKWLDYEQGKGMKPKGQPLGLTCWWHRQGKNGIEIKKPEAKLVKTIYDLYTKEGKTIRGIATYLNEIKKIKNPVSRKKRKNTGELVKSRKNAHGADVNDKWASSSIKHVLTNRTVIGEFECWTQRKEEDGDTGTVKRIREKVLNADGTHQIIKKYCPAIITKTQFLKAQALLVKNKNTNKGQKVTKSPINIFRGILFDGHTEHSISYSHSGGKARGFRYRSSVQKHRGEKASSFSVKKFEEAFFKIYSTILTNRDLFTNWEQQATAAGSGRGKRIAEIDDEVNHLVEGNNNLLVLAERGKATDDLLDRIETNNRKKEILTTEKIKLESALPMSDDTQKHRNLLGSMSKFCEVESKRIKVANILREIEIQVSVWPLGLIYNEPKMLKAFGAIYPELGKKKNWVNFNEPNFLKYPFFFLQELLYWKLAKLATEFMSEWNVRRKSALDFIFSIIHHVGAEPVQNFGRFYDIKTQPEKKNDLLFVCGKPDGTFFSGILNTSKHSKPVIKYITNSPMFTTMIFAEEAKWDKYGFIPSTINHIKSYPMLKPGIMDTEENNMQILMNKTLKKQNIKDIFPDIRTAKIPADDKKNIFNRRMLNFITTRMVNLP